MSQHPAVFQDSASLDNKGLDSFSLSIPATDSSIGPWPSATDTTANLASFYPDSSGAPQPQSLRKLAMSHLIGASATAPCSPTIRANGDRRHADARLHDGMLPPPAAPSLSSALKALHNRDADGAQPNRPFARISSTAPASPRL